MGGFNVLSAGKALLNRRRQRAIARRSHLLHSASAVVVDRLEERRMFALGFAYFSIGGIYSDLLAAHGGDPVQLSNGLLNLNTTDLQSDGFGASWGISRSWANTAAYAHPNDHVGNGWNVNQNPQLIQTNGSSGTIEVLNSASSALWFQNTGGSTYTPWGSNQQTLSYNSSNDIYTLTDLQGDQTTFYGFSNTSYGAYNGSFASYTPANGATISVTSHVGSGGSPVGAILQEQRQQTLGSTTTTETWHYNYSGGNLVGVIDQRQVGSGSPVIVRQSAYTYYGSGESYGNPGDLKTASEMDASGNVLSEDYYRYTIGSDLLYMEFTGPDFARLVANQGSTGAFTALDSTAAPFATLNVSYGTATPVTNTIPALNYNGAGFTIAPVISETVAGMGGDSTTGLGTYNFNYQTSTALANASNIALIAPLTSSSSQYNFIASTTTETLPDGLVDTYYLNYAGETVLTAEGSTGTRYTYNQYNGNGQLASTASPSAISSASVNLSTGIVTITNSSTGTPVTSYDYYTASDVSASPATNTSAGAALGYLKDTKVYTGSSQDEISSADYKSQTVNGIPIYYVADSTDYRNVSANGSGGETTSYSNVYYNNSFAVYSTTTTLPIISAAQNGSGIANTDTTYYDPDGNATWEKNPDVHLSYDAYNIATGAMTLDIQDVTLNDYSFYNTSYGATAPFTVPASDGLAIVTQYTVDAEGRTTEEISPNGNYTYTTYDDFNHSTAVYTGFHSVSGQYTTTGPVQVTHDDWALGYTETYTYAYNASSSATPNDNPEAPSALLSLTRDITNTSGQLTEEDAYFNLSGVSYNSSSLQLGSLNSTYYTTLYGYDTGGRQDRVQSATGTITRTVYDQFGEPIQTWIGAVIGGTADDASWPSAGNMVMVTQSAYDPDGNEIETVDYPSSNTATGRATENYYDYQDRLISQMTGAFDSAATLSGGASADTASNDTFLTVYTLDNLGETTETQTFNANGSNPSSTGYNVSGMILTAESTAAYDDQGQNYQTSTISVSPINGSTGSAITSYSYYDADGNLIASIGPTGAATKYSYNGADWLTTTSITDGGQLNNFSNVSIGSSTAYNAASGVFGDIVLTQTQNVYDNDGNVVETITSDRFGTDSTSSTGTLGTPTTGVNARVSYSASYYDAADRDIADVNVGTNGGSTWTRPSNVPSGSSTVLLTSTVYDPAGNTAFITDPRGIINATGYDALGRATITVNNWTAAMGPVNTTTLGTLTDSTNQTTEYTYDGDNHVTSTTAVMPSGETSQTTTYVYGVTQSQGSAADDNDLLYAIEYPNPATGTTAAPNWTFTAGVGGGSAGVSADGSGFTGGNAAAPYGSQVGVLQMYSSMSQTDYFSAGTYNLSFVADHRGLYGNEDFEVLIDGNSVGTFDPTSNTTYTAYNTSNFTVTAGMHTIAFQGLDTAGGDATAFLDNVVVNDASGTTAAPPVLADAGFESPVAGLGYFLLEPNAPDEVYTYNALSETNTYTDRNQTTHNYTYDQLGRLTNDSVTLGYDSSIDDSVNRLGYSHTNAGELYQATSYNASNGVLNQIQESYDGFGNLLGDTQAHYADVADDTTAQTVSYSYDASNEDRLTGITYPSSRTIGYNYNGSSGLDTVLSRITSLNDSSGILQSYTYLGLDTPVTFSDGNGTVLSYYSSTTTGDAGDHYVGLDRFGRVVNQSWTNSSGRSIDGFLYGYDADGNVLVRRSTAAAWDSELFSYDALNRLTSYKRGGLSSSNTSSGSPLSSETFNLTATGDWNGSSGLATGVTTNAQNQVTAANGSSIAYDLNGNLTTDQNGNAFVYDGWNRLVTINMAGGDSISYAYDALGRRITRTDAYSGITTDNYYSNQNLIEQDQSGSMTSQFVWGPFYVNQLVQETNTAGTLYVEQDADWDVTSTTSASTGSLYQRFVYDPSGNVVFNSTGTTTTYSGIGFTSEVFGFQGGYTDPTTGMVNFGVRWLITSLGIWNQPDPIGADGSGNNLYQLEGGNAVTFDDPSGLMHEAPNHFGGGPGEGEHEAVDEALDAGYSGSSGSGGFSGGGAGTFTGSGQGGLNAAGANGLANGEAGILSVGIDGGYYGGLGGFEGGGIGGFGGGGGIYGGGSIGPLTGGFDLGVAPGGTLGISPGGSSALPPTTLESILNSDPEQLNEITEVSQRLEQDASRMFDEQLKTIPKQPSGPANSGTSDYGDDIAPRGQQTTPEPSTLDKLKAAAKAAAKSVGTGKGHAYGTKVHTAFAEQVENLQNPNLFTETSYLDGKVVPYGTKGSIRVDVGEGTVLNPTAVYDLKTGSAILTSDRIAQIQAQLPGIGSNVPVTVVRPQ